MEFGILGPLLVRDDAGVRFIPAAKQRILLAALLVRRGQVAPAELLVETVWDGRPPRSAPTTLRNYVMRLRHGMGAAGERIETRAGGYLINVDPEEFDAQRFTVLRDEGVAALRQGAFDRAAALLERAIDLWRGPVLVDVPSDSIRHDEAERLTESRLDALEWKLEAELCLGRQAGVIAELRALTAAHPVRERFWAQLMTALYRSGRQSEALAVYQHIRRVLAEEIGVEPGTELREVHQRILHADPALDEPPAARSELPVQVQDSGRRDDQEAAPVTPFQIPPDVADFTARGAEVAELTARLTAGDRKSPFVAVLSGQPGVGKSALAGHVAHTARPAFVDGTLFADLRGTEQTPATPADVLETFLLTLGIPAAAIPAGLDARTALYRSVLAGRRLLVVLDNARDSAQVRPLLPNEPASAALVTSRHRLTDLVGAYAVSLDVLTAAEADHLFERMVGRARTDAEPRAAARVVAACGGLPLALRICAARLDARSSWSIRDLADRLADGRRLFDELRVGSLDVRAEFTRSYDALDRPTARAFHLLALPEAPTVRIDFAAALLGESAPRTELILECLVDAHLLVARGPGRYGYSDLLRTFAREQSLGLVPGERWPHGWSCGVDGDDPGARRARRTPPTPSAVRALGVG